MSNVDKETAMASGSASLASRLFDETVRFDVLLWLPGALAGGEAFPDSFREDFVENLPDRPDDPLYSDLPELAFLIADDGEYEAWEVADALTAKDRSGFLARFATPVTTPFKKGGYSFSWGHYRTCWRYADTIERLAEIAIEWAQASREHDKAKAA